MKAELDGICRLLTGAAVHALFSARLQLDGIDLTLIRLTQGYGILSPLHLGIEKVLLQQVHYSNSTGFSVTELEIWLLARPLIRSTVEAWLSRD